MFPDTRIPLLNVHAYPACCPANDATVSMKTAQISRLVSDISHTICRQMNSDHLCKKTSTAGLFW